MPGSAFHGLDNMGATHSRLRGTPQYESATPIASCLAAEVLPIAPHPSMIPSAPSLSSRTIGISRNDRAARSHFRFLDLPPEVRNMIYKELVVVGKVFYTPDDYDIQNGSRCHDYKLFRKPELQLLRVCKQIHTEAESLYLSKNLFVLPIDWRECHPFTNFRSQYENKAVTDRHIFSSAGLTNVRNISVAVDQRLTKSRGYKHTDWKSHDLVCSLTSFRNLTAQGRYRKVHQMLLHDVNENYDDTFYTLTKFEAGLLYVEVDCTNAYCPFGDCKPMVTGLIYWVRYVKPNAIDILGLESMEEKQDILSLAASTGISHRQLRHDYGLRFRKLGDNKAWDMWKMEREPEDESKDDMDIGQTCGTF